MFLLCSNTWCATISWSPDFKQLVLNSYRKIHSRLPVFRKTLHWLLYSAIPLDNRIKLHVSAKRINGIMTFTEHIKYLNTSENMWLCKGLQFLNVKLSLKWKVFQKPIWIPNSKQYIHYIFFWNRFFSSEGWCILHHRNFEPVLLPVMWNPTEFQPARV